MKNEVSKRESGKYQWRERKRKWNEVRGTEGDRERQKDTYLHREC